MVPRFTKVQGFTRKVHMKGSLGLMEIIFVILTFRAFNIRSIVEDAFFFQNDSDDSFVVQFHAAVEDIAKRIQGFCSIQVYL